MKKIFSIIVTAALIASLSATFCVASASAFFTLDDGSEVLTRDDGSYYVEIPAGHPRIPLIVCDGATEIKQAFIPEDVKSGFGGIDINGEMTLVEFVKTEKKGFALQYDDHYEYDFGISGDVILTSSNEDIIAIEDNILVVKAVSDEDVEIKASNGEEEKTLVVTQTDKAPINIMLLIGQSNSQGISGDEKLSVNPKKGVGYNYCILWHGNDNAVAMKDKIYNYYSNHPQYSQMLHEQAASGAGNQGCQYFRSNMGADNYYDAAKKDHGEVMVDMSEGWRGLQNPYAEEYYALTGEKTLAILGGVGGSSMFEWWPGFEGEIGPHLYDNAIKRYPEAIAALGDNYEVRKQGWHWVQGEADMIRFSNYLYLNQFDPECDKLDVYKNRLHDMHKGLKEELSLDYGSIFVVRDTSDTDWEYSTLENIRTAQLELAIENSDIYIATDLCEQIPNAMSDHVFHYNQQGYNLIGADAADNMVKRESAKADNNIKDIAIYLDYTHVRADKNDILTVDSLRGKKTGTKDYTIAFMSYPVNAEADNFSIDYDKNSGLTIENGKLSITHEFTETPLTVSLGDYTKTFIVRNKNFEKSVEAKYNADENLIYINGKMGNMAGSQVGISLINIKTGEAVYIDQAEADENSFINHLISFDGDIKDYNVKITAPDKYFRNTEEIVLEIAKVYDTLDVSAQVSLNTNALDTDMHTYSINYVFTSAFRKNIDGTVVCAYYDKNGVLIDMLSQNLTVDAYNGAALKADVHYNAKTAKIFVFDSYNSIVPLTDDTVMINR